MRVLVIDGQGGGLGRQLVTAITALCPEVELTAVGTNSMAASAMLKAGAARAATGENAVGVNARRADIIVGPSASSLRMPCWARSLPPWRRPSARRTPSGCSSR